MKRQNARLEIFLSLSWYEVALRFLFTFVAKTSEVLLAAGLVVSTANFLTDGSILATYPGVSIAWAWAQALAIDSSLGVSLSYAFQCFKQEEWIRGALYGLLTLLLAGVAGGITNVDIVSHALHLSISDAMVQMGINVAILSRLRAIAVIGFILMGRLRDLPAMALPTKKVSEPQQSLAPGPSQEPPIQTTIRSLCSQFSGEEIAQILNACIAAKKLVLARVPPKRIVEPEPLQVDQQRQGHSSKHASKPDGTETVQGEPEVFKEVPLVQSEPDPVASMELLRKAPTTVKHHLLRDPVSSSQGLHASVSIVGVPSKKLAISREPASEGTTPLESDDAPPQERLEQAYQSLVAEGKKPSGRALAERAQVHRSTCVEWLRMKQQLAPENERLPEEPEQNDLSVPDPFPDDGLMGLPGKALEHETASIQAEPPDPARMNLPEVEQNQEGRAGNVSSDLFPNFSVPEDIPDV